MRDTPWLSVPASGPCEQLLPRSSAAIHRPWNERSRPDAFFEDPPRPRLRPDPGRWHSRSPRGARAVVPDPLRRSPRPP
jgi:hypothetical protein